MLQLNHVYAHPLLKILLPLFHLYQQ